MAKNISNLDKSLKQNITPADIGAATTSSVTTVSNNIGALSNLKTSEKGSLVGAINELFQSANNGKELIASAIGEPLSSNDTFSAMSSDINSLLNTFKTNMMNNGVTVESGDKFKSLIDKIAALADSEGKGVQITSGDMLFNAWTSNIHPNWSSYYVTTSLDFTPSRILVYFTACGYYNTGAYHKSFVLDSNYSNSSDNMLFLDDGGGTAYLYISDITPEGFTIYYSGDRGGLNFKATEWHAIGVGEEDTTLRDSLADILENKGVDVTEEDDMASLIGKVDGISGSLDIISATTLPATGKENQICVITDNPTDYFLISQNIDDMTSSNNSISIYTATSGTKISITTNNLVTNYYIGKVCQGDSRLASYIYQNGNWNQLTQKYVVLLENGTYLNNSYHGGIFGSNSAMYSGGTGIYNKNSSTSNQSFVTFNNTIDFSVYNTIKVTAYTSASNKGYLYVFASVGNINSTSDSSLKRNYQTSIETVTITAKTFTFDISNWTGSHQLGVYLSGGYSSQGYITDITLY